MQRRFSSTSTTQTSSLENFVACCDDDGHLVLSTPNLCAWFNRLLVRPLGVQPIFYETSTESSLVGAGVLRRFKRGEHPVGHVRLFTLRALSDLLGRAGFSIVEARGAVFDKGLPPRLLAGLTAPSRSRPSLASLLVVLARRTGPDTQSLA